MAEGMAFDQLKPQASVTDPQGYGLQTEYPKHLHQAGTADDGGPRYVVVHDAAEEADAIAAGWRLVKPAPPGTRLYRPPTETTEPAEAPPPRKR
jgi:hypothetical protein